MPGIDMGLGSSHRERAVTKNGEECGDMIYKEGE